MARLLGTEVVDDVSYQLPKGLGWQNQRERLVKQALKDWKEKDGPNSII